jgi:hypothetical protein
MSACNIGVGVEAAECNLPPSIFLQIKQKSSGIELYPATELRIWDWVISQIIWDNTGR